MVLARHGALNLYAASSVLSPRTDFAPFPPFEPDRADWAPDASDAFRNVLPVRDGWGPLKKLVGFTGPLPAPCRGAIAVRKNDGSFSVFAATATKLFRLNPTDFTWEDVSQASVTYTLPGTDTWSFRQFKTEDDNLLLAANPNDPIQVFDLESGTAFADLAGSPMQVRYLAVVGFHLGIFSGNDDAMKLALSGVSEPTFWAPFQRGADEQVLTSGGAIRGVVGDASGAFVALRDKWVRLDLTGRSDISFIINETVPLGPGVVAPDSIVNLGSQIFFKAEEGFYILGAPSTPIGAERVDRAIELEQNRDFAQAVQGAADAVSQNIIWRYWSANHGNENHSDRIIGYNRQLDRWWAADIDLQFVFSAATTAITIDGALLGDTLLDSGPFADVLVDSRIFQGGQPVFAGFNEDNEMGFFTGANLAATLETADISLAGTNTRRVFVQGARLISGARNATMQVASLEELGGARTWGAEVSKAADGSYPMRSDGRFHRFRMKTAEGEDWSHATGVEPNFRVSGRR